MKSKLPVYVLLFSLGVQSAAVRADDPSPWTGWYHENPLKAVLALRSMRETLLEKNLHDPNLSWEGYGKSVDCSLPAARNFRTADGTCNTLEVPLAGSAGVAFGRNIPPSFIDHDGPAKLMTPSPADVSKVFFKRDEFKPIPWLNMLTASWIQFMNHDWLTHGKNLESNPYHVPGVASSAAAVERTRTNPVDAAYIKPEFGARTTLNEVTHWWDGSQIYGSSQAEQDAIRGLDRSKPRPVSLIGKIRTVTVNGRELLPDAGDLNPQSNKQNRGRELTGFRENWWVGLSMLHTLFVKEHNAIANELIKKHVRFDTEKNTFIWRNGKQKKTFDINGIDEQVFQTARLINAAVMAKIHTVEWTPAILDHPVARTALYTNWYGTLNPNTLGGILKWLPNRLKRTDFFENIDAGYLLGGIVGSKSNSYGAPFSITEEFTSVYRLHSLIPDKLVLKKESSLRTSRAIPFEESRNEKSYELMAGNDLKDLFYSFGTQNPGQLVLNNFPKALQELQIPGYGTMDLAMVDIMRDRERGVPRYNQFRRAISLKPIEKYADFFPEGRPQNERQQQILDNLYKVYGKDNAGNDNVELVDLLVGTSAEEVRPAPAKLEKGHGFGFGETMFQIFILMASRRLMADRFFTDNYTDDYYTRTGLNWIDQKGWLHDIIGRHMPELKPHLKGLKTAFNPWNP